MSSDLVVGLQEGITTVELESRYDIAGNVKFERTKDLLTKQSKTIDPPRLLLDFNHTTFFGSNFVGLLFALRRTLVDRGGRLALCSVSPECLKVLEVVRFHTVCPIYKTRNEAIKALTDEAATAE